MMVQVDNINNFFQSCVFVFPLKNNRSRSLTLNHAVEYDIGGVYSPFWTSS